MIDQLLKITTFKNEDSRSHFLELNSLAQALAFARDYHSDCATVSFHKIGEKVFSLSPADKVLKS